MGKRIAAVAGVIVLIGVVVGVLSQPDQAKLGYNSTALQLGRLTTCGIDATSALSAFLNGAPDGTSITLPQNACFLVNSTLTIQGTNDVTINGNEATFKQTVLPTAPLLQLFSDTNLTIAGLTLDGATTNDAQGGEINYGVALESDNGVSFTNDTIENFGGDWVYLEPPYDTHRIINTNITFNQDTFRNAGYHGFTIESVGCLTAAPCNGLTVENSTMTNMQVDAMDFEVDLASSDFANGVPTDFAQDYITIANNDWTNWNGSDWFVSDQGQSNHTSGCPSSLGCGVEQKHVVLTDNTLNDTAPFMEVVGSSPTYAGAGLNLFLTVTGNHYSPGQTVKPYRGGTSPAISLENVFAINFSNNSLPWCPGSNPPACNGSPPAEYEMHLVTSYSTFKNNNFFGAIAPADPTSQLYYVGFCGNTYGVGGSQTDGAC